MPGEVSTALFLTTLGVLTFALVCAGLVGGGWAMYRLTRLMRLDFADDLARARSDCEREIQDLRAASERELSELRAELKSMRGTLTDAMRLMSAPRGGLNIEAEEVNFAGDATGRDKIRNDQTFNNPK